MIKLWFLRNFFSADEVKKYQEFLVLNGGLNGGWDDFDHSTFLKAYDHDSQQKKYLTPRSWPFKE